MAAKKGDGLLMVYCEVPAKHEEEFNAWYDEEHNPECLSIPGVLSAARYQAVAGGPEYLASYELATRQLVGLPVSWTTPNFSRSVRFRRSSPRLMIACRDRF